MEEDQPRIRWGLRIRPMLLQRLYESDASGLQDERLCDEVGLRLYDRCETFCLVSRREVRCPVCGEVFEVAREGTSICTGKGCGFDTDWQAYRRTIHNHYASPGRAIDAWRTFCAQYPRAKSYREKMILIDQLIHSFHVCETTAVPKKSVASKLLEGNKKDVVAFLDSLSGLDAEAKRDWRRIVMTTQDRGVLKGS